MEFIALAMVPTNFLFILTAAARNPTSLPQVVMTMTGSRN